MPPPPPIRLIAPDVSSAVLVAYSGGVDSSVLLHLLADDAAIRAHGLRALHVHHGLRPDADLWAAHCLRVCADLGIDCDIVRVTVERDSGLGPEAAARHARREVFARTLRTGETLALAQHRDDQAETFLLRALRASGPDGLASMRPWRHFAAGWMWRPLLDTPRAALLSHARARSLAWIEDSSNADIALDRNFLRHRVLPMLRERWPDADAAFARAAMLAAQSSALLSEQDARTLAAVRDGNGAALSVPALRDLPAARRARVLRHWVASLDWPPLPAKGIARIDTDLLGIEADRAARDRMPSFAWHSVEIRRWRDGLYAIETGRALDPAWSCRWDGCAMLTLPNGDSLELAGASGFPSPLLVHARRGGERILLPDRGEHHHTLKHVLQEQGIPPWERARMPLISTGENGILLAVADRLRSAGFEHWMQSQGARLVWTRRPAPVG
ncbi:MAG: tRNA lysidine(34) synthetase TilS [Lysobacter sp.]|nr:tRNA lysidine(34) synthetase TilS [Lysobacter sp.]